MALLSLAGKLGLMAKIANPACNSSARHLVGNHGALSALALEVERRRDGTQCWEHYYTCHAGLRSTSLLDPTEPGRLH